MVVNANNEFVNYTKHPKSSPICLTVDDKAGKKYYESLGYSIVPAQPKAKKTKESKTLSTITVPQSATDLERQLAKGSDSSHKPSQVKSITIKAIKFPFRATVYYTLKDDPKQIHLYGGSKTVNNLAELEKFSRDSAQKLEYTQYENVEQVHPAIIVAAGLPIKLTGLGHNLLENCMMFAIHLHTPDKVKKIYGHTKNNWLAKATAELTNTLVGQIIAGVLGNQPLAKSLVVPSQ